MDCENCPRKNVCTDEEKLQARRIDELNTWLKSSCFREMTDEDTETIVFLTHELGIILRGTGIPARLVTPQDVADFSRACYILGLKRGYETKTLEVLFNGKVK